MLKFVYSFFLGLLLVIFVGMGVASFYEAPQAPEYPKVLETARTSPDEYTAEQRQAEEAYEADSKAYSQQTDDYSRNVSMIVLGAAVVLVVLGLALHSKLDALADGLLLGGTFTLAYSIIRSLFGNDPAYSFMVITVALLVTMVVGYLKFIKPAAKRKK
jgi:hypothetical protein